MGGTQSFEVKWDYTDQDDSIIKDLHNCAKLYGSASCTVDRSGKKNIKYVIKYRYFREEPIAPDMNFLFMLENIPNNYGALGAKAQKI